MSGRLKIKLFGLITFINVAIGVTLGGLLYTIWPDHYFEWYPSIPLFYWIMALAMVFFLDKVKLEEGDLPPVLDVEHKPADMSIEDFQTEILTWLHIVEDKYHVKPIIYTYYKFKENYLSDSRFDSYPYWIAHYYVDKMEYKGEWKFWQHTDAGKLPGIDGYVDLNIYNGSYYDLRRLTIR